MTRIAFRSAVAAARAWTWLYTLPLEAAERDNRRREIESDLWEFDTDPTRVASLRAAAHVISRILLGIPDDLLWTCERFVSRPQPLLRASVVVRLAMFAVATATAALSASGPSVDPARALRVNVEAAGWTDDGESVSKTAGARRAEEERAVAPALAFKLSNVSDRSTSALQINAVFQHADDRRPSGAFGTAFAQVVGWRGIAAGATGPRIVVRGQGLYVIDARSGRPVAVPVEHVDAASVRLYVHHEGRWTRLGDFAIPARAMTR